MTERNLLEGFKGNDRVKALMERGDYESVAKLAIGIGTVESSDELRLYGQELMRRARFGLPRRKRFG